MHAPRHQLVALVATLLVVVAPIASAQDAAPNAVVTEPIADVGVVPKGESVTHDFVLENRGTATLVIREVRPACGCTVAEYTEEIAPGGRGMVRAVLDTTAFRGPIAKSVTVFTNDRRNPSIELTVRARVEPYVEVLPGYARFNHVQGTAPKAEPQTVWATDGTDLEILRVESPFPYLEAKVRRATDGERESGGPAQQLRLSLVLASDAPEGPLAGNVVLRTNHPEMPKIEIPVAGYVRPVIMVSPPVADFGRFAASEPRKVSVVVTNYGREDMRVTDVSSDLDGLETSVDEKEPGKRYFVYVTLPPNLPPGPLDGRLEIHTDSSSHPVVEVELRGDVL